MGARRNGSGPKKGSERVKGWIYEVLNPVLEAVEQELAFLANGNVTFQMHDKRLQAIRSIHDYLLSDGRHILRDFVRAERGARARLDEHDGHVADLASAAVSAFDAILRAPGFSDAVDRAFREHLTRCPNDQPTGAFPAERLPELVAENLVNNARVLPWSRTDGPFWEAFRERFSAFARTPEHAELARSRKQIIGADLALKKWLEDTSYRLCKAYDVPAAPLSSSAA